MLHIVDPYTAESLADLLHLGVHAISSMICSSVVVQTKGLGAWSCRSVGEIPPCRLRRVPLSRVLLERLWAAGASVRAYDPVAMREARLLYGARSELTLCATAMQALEGADALAIVTEWPEFRSPDFELMRRMLREAVLFDGRNLYDPAMLKDLGWRYYAIGRGETANGGARSHVTALRNEQRAVAAA